jgi:hypothetical protein
MSKLTAEKLREILDYNPETGDFIWRIRPSARSRRRAGSVAGQTANGRRVIVWQTRRYAASRLAVLWMIGEWQSKFVDHIDRNPLNNRWSNLRQVTHHENCLNRLGRPRKENLPAGVQRNGKYFQGEIRIRGKRHCTRCFKNPDDAYSAYRKLARAVKGDFCPDL